jgi:hypothetical protein
MPLADISDRADRCDGSVVVGPTSPIVVVPMADHIGFACVGWPRAPDEYPLRWEVHYLYPAGLIGPPGAGPHRFERGVRLPDTGGVPLALHFVNAFGAGIFLTLQMTELLQRILVIIGEEYNVVIDEGPSRWRFVTHLRYLFHREQQKKLQQTPAELHGRCGRPASRICLGRADR